MSDQFTTAELERYLDEALPCDQMAAIEAALRADPGLARQLTAINVRRDSSTHSAGAIWRRHRISCPSREQLGSHLLGVLEDDAAEYVEFHLKTIGCRYCQANLADLERQRAESPHAAANRQRRYFQSSAGYLKP